MCRYPAKNQSSQRTVRQAFQAYLAAQIHCSSARFRTIYLAQRAYFSAQSAKTHHQVRGRQPHHDCPARGTPWRSAQAIISGISAPTITTGPAGADRKIRAMRSPKTPAPCGWRVTDGGQTRLSTPSTSGDTANTVCQRRSRDTRRISFLVW